MTRRPRKSDPETAEAFLGNEDLDIPTVEHRENPSKVLASLILEKALTRATRKRLQNERGLAVLVEPPTAAWVLQVRSALCLAFDWGMTDARDGMGRTRKPTDGAAELADVIASGQRVVVVCHAPDAHVPPAFIAAADLRIRLNRPTAAMVSTAIRKLTGKAARRVPAQVEILDLPDIASALRNGIGGPAGCVRRLERAIAAKSSPGANLRRVPPVHELHGQGEAGVWARRLVDDYRTMAPADFWAQADKSVVVFGDPGVGKTSLAHSLSVSTGLPLLETSVAAWFEGSGYLDKTLAAMTEAFAAARSHGGNGCVLVLDELDGMPGRKAASSDRDSTYWMPLQAAYLRAVETTAAPGSRVILIGCTNFPDRLDPALLRPGRLGRLIHVRRPDAAGIAGILRQHLGDDLAGIDLTGVAAAGVGSTGADVTAWIAQARRTARLAGRSLRIGDLLEAVLPADDRSEADRYRCAVHESAHSVVAHMMGGGRIRRVTIVATGQMGGTTELDDHGSAVMSKETLDARIMAALAGRAGEEEFGLGPTTGAHHDLAQATGIATAIRTSYGLGDSLLHRSHVDRASGLLDFDAALRKAVEGDLARLYADTLACVRRHRSLIEDLARLLMKTRIVEAPAFLRLVGDYEAALDRFVASTMGVSHG
ncbi:AAA family ATPase [Methylobacterium sp. J-090]|uniref:AAA family ATPase n=1 Tax=Methylobacterium sp. J-090 TaxID=2836666 RepID=UPI001FBBCC6B|nr:AAA family ATPase [Methylobacterium sp. J-090]MCJ2082486.1 AAA family ATPase [Methylobacterium sp. J-090]